jgi:flagellar basal-body rod protein FlgF
VGELTVADGCIVSGKIGPVLPFAAPKVGKMCADREPFARRAGWQPGEWAKIAVAWPVLSSTGMNVSLYQAAAAMSANTRWQEIVSENLGASPIPGARRQQVSFSAIEAGMAPGLTGQQGGRYMIPKASASINFQQGSLQPSPKSTDVAIEGPGFLEIQLPDGSHGFTRDGELHLSAQGQLITKQGYTVLGEGGALQIDPNTSTPISISASGDISQGGEVKGRIKLAEFSQPSLLTKIGGGCFIIGSSNLQPEAAKASSLRQGFLEAANSSPTIEMASLLTSMRMFEANQKVMELQDDRMGKVISELGTPS